MRTELSAPPDTMYFGLLQSQACTLSSWPNKSNNGAFGQRISHNLTWLSYDPEIKRFSSVGDQQTDCIHCECPKYVLFTIVPAKWLKNNY